MKTLLTFLSISCLNGAFLYPLFVGGLGRPVSWFMVALLAVIGTLCLYLLVRFRKVL
jgi:Na+/melibiose symporter-like transporter